ncbi:Nrap protein [Xylariales sp. AK1849]|nr:Nrap protein [Xylariales sp. AK1849]
MVENSAKRRKLGHPNGRGPSLQNGTSSTSAGSVLIEAAEQLLKDVRVTGLAGVDDTLRQFKDVIEALEPREPLPVGGASSAFEKANKMTIPYPDPRPSKDSLLKVMFAKPAGINVVGSYQLGTLVSSQSELGVDMIVVMPPSLFQDKDFRDFRYFYKRQFYLAYIAAGIRKSFSSSLDLTFEHLHSNNLLPILVARPRASAKSDEKNSYAIRVIPCAPEGIFPSSKLSPTNNAIRQGATGDFKNLGAPTPYYNATLKAESLYSSYLLLLNSTAKSCPAYKDSLILGRIWLQQRGFNGTSGCGFGHFELAVLVALLLQGGGRKGEAVLSTSLSATQILKATLQFLAVTDLQKKPIILGPQPSNMDAVRQNGPILYDAVRDLNLLWKMTPWSANFLQHQARWSLAGFKNDSLDQFDSLFIIKVDQPLQTFDLLVRVELPSQAVGSLQLGDHRGLAWDFSERLHQVLKKSLGDRARLVHIILPKEDGWSLSTSPFDTNNGVLVGIILDSAHANRRMDRGPSVEQKEEAASFREFWGEKAELRRFVDGSIQESLQWDQDPSAGIPEQIIRYTCKMHLSLLEDGLKFYGSGKFSTIAHIAYADSQQYTAAKKAFETLERSIRDLADLPLHVRNISPTCPELRYASLRPPSPAETPIRPMDVVLGWEASGKWTDNIAANQRLKIAFLLKIGESLTEESKAEVKVHLGLDNAARDTRNLAFLDIVFVDSGFAFRLRIQSDHEEKELANQAKAKQLERHIQMEAVRSLAIAKRLYTTLPVHNQTVSTWCTRLPPLSDSIRLFKYWITCHKLSCHFDEELLELFVLQAFTKPYPRQTPSSAMTGFLRTLELLSLWDWHEEPLIVDHAESISASKRSATHAHFRECRNSDPRLNRIVLFVADSHDTSGTAFTQAGPSRVIANQLTKLARAACELVKTKSIDLDPRLLFQSSLRHYDVVIRLAPKVLKGVLKEDGTKHSHFRNLNERNVKMALPLAEHPAKALLRQLNATYSNALVFFHGGQNDNVIAGLWNPELGSRSRKLDMPCSFKPVRSDEASLEVDKTSIVAEIARIGGDLIEKIEAKEGK